MNSYEAIFIINPGLSEDDVKAAVEKLSQGLTGGEGTIEESVPMGKRRLAYTIGKDDEGIYHRFNFTSSPENIDSFKNGLKLNQDVIRHLILKNG